ncbi:MAG: hypothetical protein IKH57_25820 [Clostridia bacterium]|nr:hypothetical protein [Clostridia bacterium]
MKKWNPENHEYERYSPPPGYITIYETDMETPINCAACGKHLTFGEGYSSMQIHNDYGMGYTVCPSCHETELQEEMKCRGISHTERSGESCCDSL